MNKPITVNQLKKLCEEQIEEGNGNKVIMISDDDEGNGFHYLWYAFAPSNDLIENYMIEEKIASKENTIVLG